jgi:hypothetical protein
MVVTPPFKEHQMRRLVFGAGAAVAIAAAAPLHGAHAEPVATVVACGGRDVAVYKLDVVELYKTHRTIEGSCQHLLRYDNAYLAFVDTANADEYERHPDRYAVPFGAFCAMGVSGYAPKDVPPHLTIAPKVIDWYGDRPYFQTDQGKDDLWRTDPEKFIALAASNFATGNYTVRFSASYAPEHPEE